MIFTDFVWRSEEKSEHKNQMGLKKLPFLLNIVEIEAILLAKFLVFFFRICDIFKTKKINSNEKINVKKN